MALAFLLAASGCATRAQRGGFSCDRRWGLGTVGGAVAGALVGGGVGAVSGALIGGLLGHCGFDPRRIEPIPPPPPPPAPSPPARRKIVLRGVNFDFDKATIRPDAADILAEAARILEEEPGINVSVDGHTDAVGSDAYNERLSEQRAGAVRDHLARLGVAPGRLQTRGFGESRPVASNATEEGRAQNRRVELNVIGDRY